ncbi:MAG: hypothetical protein NVS3B11_25370 [Collimonas sp.]
MSKYAYLLHTPLFALSAFTATPLMAADNDANISAAIKTISRDHAESLKGSALTEKHDKGSDFLPGMANSDIASQNIESLRNPLSGRGNCFKPWNDWSPWSAAAMSMALGAVTSNYSGASVLPSDPSQLCDRAVPD